MVYAVVTRNDLGYLSFNHRVKNLTQIQFSTQEVHLLNKGLQYNLHYKQKSCIETLALEAELQFAISTLPNKNT
jgi:hypothetical protein